MAEACSLGQTGRARGVDEEQGFPAAKRRPRVRGGIVRGLRSERRVEVAGFGGVLDGLARCLGIALRPHAQRSFEVRGRGREAVRALAPEQQRVGPGGREGVAQAAAAEVRVDQGRGHADLRQSSPRDQVLGPVLHEQGHDIAAAQALPARPVGHAVGRGVELAVAEAPGFEPHEGPVGVVAGATLDDVGDGEAAIRLELRQTRQRRQNAEEEGPASRHGASLSREPMREAQRSAAIPASKRGSCWKRSTW